MNEVGAILLGFQLVALSWRIQREIKMQEAGQRTWFTLADYLVVLSMMSILLGTFLIPTFVLSARWPIVSIGVSVAFLVFSPIVAACHYGLFRGKRPCPAPYALPEEWIMFAVSVAGVVIYAGVAIALA